MRSALDEKKISAAELTKHYLDRIEKTDLKNKQLYYRMCRKRPERRGSGTKAD